MRALLIVHDNYQDDNHFPLGIAYIASMLRENNVDVHIYSMDVYHYTHKQLANYLNKNEFDIIGLGFMAARFNETIVPLSQVINKHKKNAWFVLGGHGPSPIPEYMLNKVKADCVVVGECENSIIKIIEDKQSNNNKVIYHGKPTKHLDELPLPAWDLFPTSIYADCFKLYDMTNEDKTLDIISSRGCVNRCNFCYRMEDGIRIRSISKIIDEIKYLKNVYGINYFQFADELFIISKRRLEQFYTALQDNNLNIRYWCNARVDLVDEELLELLKQSGCGFVNYGFESMDANVLNAMHKNTTPEQNEYVAKLTKEFNIPFGLNLIWNNIHDTLDTLEQNKEFIKEYNLFGQLRTIRPVTAYPGCDLYYYAIRNGLIQGPEDFFNRFKNSDLIHTNFTDLDIDMMYEALYKTNKELIYHHYNSICGDMREASNLVSQFYELYFKNFYKFRGARHYEKEE